MERARIAIFEDNAPVRELLTLLAEVNGHEVRAEASTMDEAMSVIESLSPDDIDVAVVDGNLERGATTGYDGAVIARLLKEKFTEVVVIGFSGNQEVENCDHNFSKGDPSSTKDLTAFIGEL